MSGNFAAVRIEEGFEEPQIADGIILNDVDCITLGSEETGRKITTGERVIMEPESTGLVVDLIEADEFDPDAVSTPIRRQVKIVTRDSLRDAVLINCAELGYQEVTLEDNRLLSLGGLDTKSSRFRPITVYLMEKGDLSFVLESANGIKTHTKMKGLQVNKTKRTISCPNGSSAIINPNNKTIRVLTRNGGFDIPFDEVIAVADNLHKTLWFNR